MQVKAIGKEKFGESAYAIYVFRVSVNIGEENFGEWLIICHFSPTKISRVQY